MADSDRLRIQRTGTIINATSKQQEKEVIQALYQVVDYLSDRFGARITLSHEKDGF